MPGAQRAATSALTPIESGYLRDRVFLQLRDAIVSGALEPGAPIVIDSLAAAFGLSAMPVREATKRLVADGLVEELPRRAHRVAPLTRSSALDVLEIVGTLMIRAYELGVPKLDAAGIRAMRQALDEGIGHAAASDLTAVLSCVHRMHSVVYAATGNPEFERIIGSVAPRFDRVLYLWYTDSISNVGESYRADLVEALEDGRRDDAVTLLRGAWERLRETIVRRSEDAS